MKKRYLNKTIDKPYYNLIKPDLKTTEGTKILFWPNLLFIERDMMSDMKAHIHTIHPTILNTRENPSKDLFELWAHFNENMNYLIYI